ncbi:TlpA family protein disulfide reductase [Mucilaginibacter myungsuensis]|uniref:Redoxin domain-containing protein n=1 Tax=Mucilaginibacter myungsuensis TaxID=649104 RepID=A0A929PX58_9SPHI|nr:redoxin domain-containing protein [Mucilaginibacter myungsuensis]MBE9663513.1 redoxin domain-containing protein [Mucilaginibacter myungsuensis]MDN3600251.1 redoxin domain-containing protein [Mucilaginibacter myungsuensis]
MKKLLVLLSFVLTATLGYATKEAGAGTGTAPKPKPIPNYKILTTDSVWKTPANLAKGKPVVLIYFAPDCSHCLKMMYEMQPKLKELAGIQVVMITWSNNHDIRAIKIFKRDFDLKKHPNFTIGTEGYTGVVQRYYEIDTTPYLALYDSNRKWVKAFDKVTKTEEILAALKKLK